MDVYYEFRQIASSYYTHFTAFFTMLHNIFQSMRRFSNASGNPGHSNPSCNIKRLQGKIAIVTGSTDGIGLAIARRLAQEGAKVVISSRKEENVQRTVEQLKGEGLDVIGIVCHVGHADDRKRLFEKAKTDFGGLDILVTNAATNPVTTTVLETPEEIWDDIFNINVKATYLLMQESLPLLRLSKSPSIILVASIVGYQPISMIGVYSVTKTAILGLTKVTASDLASEGIRVNCVAPGIIETKFSTMLYETEEAYQESLSKIKMGRLGKPEDIAGAAAFLASDDASYVTGETIIIAGGMPSRL